MTETCLVHLLLLAMGEMLEECTRGVSFPLLYEREAVKKLNYPPSANLSRSALYHMVQGEGRG